MQVVSQAPNEYNEQVLVRLCYYDKVSWAKPAFGAAIGIGLGRLLQIGRLVTRVRWGAPRES